MPPNRSGGRRRRQPTAIAEGDRWLSDGLKVASNCWVGVQIRLYLIADLVLGLAFEAGEEVVHVGMLNQVVRRVERDSGHHPRKLGGSARRWLRGRRLGSCDGGGAEKHRTGQGSGADRSLHRAAREVC